MKMTKVPGGTVGILEEGEVCEVVVAKVGESEDYVRSKAAAAVVEKVNAVLFAEELAKVKAASVSAVKPTEREPVKEPTP